MSYSDRQVEEGVVSGAEQVEQVDQTEKENDFLPAVQ